MKVKLLFPLFALLFSISTFSQTLNQPADLSICDGNNDGIADFDLELQTSQILGNLNPNEYTITYHESEIDAFQQVNPLISPYTNVTNPQTIYVSAVNNTTGNIEILTFGLYVDTLPINGFAQDVISCDEGNGFSTFNLSQFDLEFTGGDPTLVVAYYETLQDADANTNPIPNPDFYTNIVPYFQTIYVRIEDDLGCYFVSDNVVLYLNVSQEIFINEPTPYVICDEDDDGISVFNLDSKTPEILGGNQNPTLLVTYHNTLADAESFFNVLDPIYTNINPFTETLYVRVSDNTGNCFQTTSLELVVDVNCLFVNPAVTLEGCTDDPNLSAPFDLTEANPLILNGLNPVDFSITYYLSQADADNQFNPIPNPDAYVSTIQADVVYAYVEELASGNSAIATIYLLANLNPQIDFNGPYTICIGNEIVLYPFINNDNGAYEYLWSTGETSPEIVVNQVGGYTVTITDLISGCTSSASVDVIEGGDAPVLSDAADLYSCVPNSIFDLTTTLPEILNGQDPSQFIINFFDDANSAYSNTNPIFDATNFIALEATETIFVRIQNNDGDCFSISDFIITTDNSCPIAIDCEQPINNAFCYVSSQVTEFWYESSDNSALQVFFNAGQIEVDYDSLVVLDSDGVTNLNPEETTYGNDGDLTGLSFTSTGNSIRIAIYADDSISCFNQNYTPIDYDVSCVDPDALPNCNTSLMQPLDGSVGVDEETNITWTAASGSVIGYKLSLGITSGGTEVLDNEDVGNVFTYDAGTLDYEVTYYVTITPYNTNGDAEGCIEKSFTTRANPNQIVICDDGVVNSTHCYTNDDVTEFNFESSDGLPLTIFFNSGGTEVDYDEVSIIDSDGSVLNPNQLYGNDGNFTGLTFTSSGSSLTVKYDSDFTISCAEGSNCCTEAFDFDVFCTSSVGIIEVNAFVDDNANNVFDANEFNFSNGYFTYEINGDGNINTVNSSTGSFQIISENETDVYEITFNLYEESAGCYDITMAIFDNISVAEGNTVAVDFAVVEEQSCEDLAVYLINYWTPPRPGFSHENFLVLENLGFTNISSGTVEFTHDPLLIYNGVINVNPNYTITSTGTGFTVDFVNLQPGDIEYIDISLTCPVTVELGDILTNTATYLTDSNDLVAGNNYSTLSELVVGSWDPNDKMESHGPKVLFDDFVISDEWLYYTVRFQNLGTAEAIFVRIEDALDASLDETTFQMLRSSHDNVVTRNENSLEWYFDDINLPAEQDDVEGSNGYVYFRVKPRAGYVLGDIIPNTAAIYFDFNAPVITNRFETEFTDDALSVTEFGINNFQMFPNPANDILNIKLNTITNATLSIYDLQGKLVLDRIISQEQNLELNVSDLQSGLYFVKLNTETQELVKKLIIE